MPLYCYNDLYLIAIPHPKHTHLPSVVEGVGGVAIAVQLIGGQSGGSSRLTFIQISYGRSSGTRHLLQVSFVSQHLVNTVCVYIHARDKINSISNNRSKINNCS